MTETLPTDEQLAAAFQSAPASFLTPGAPPPGARTAEAVERLRAALRDASSAGR